MADQAREQTDKILSNIEKRLNKIYNEAADDISKKWYSYMQSHESVLKNTYNALQEAKKSGDQDAIQKAQEGYDRAVKNVTLNNDKYKAMLNETTTKLAHTNEMALDYVNGKTAKIYTLNYNEFANQDIDGYTFTLVNEQAVKNLAMEDKSLLPKKKLDIPKDKRWNTKNINSELLQGILQGESITKIAGRLEHVTDMNKVSAIRNARTMTTSAENKGRTDSFKKAEEDGVIMTREWVATPDERTRAWHAALDHIAVKVDEPWITEYGPIMYPGDPSADPANVYNCRCSVRARVQGFRWDKKKEEELETKVEIEEQVTEQVSEHIMSEGQDISETWERRPDQFNFEIEDVLNAQGFDGLPRVVDPDEFDRYVQNNNIIMQRGYTAPDLETLESYRDQFCNGKWYVECKGGSAFGNGMYTTIGFDGQITDRMASTVAHYSGNGVIGRIDTMTLESGTKFISFDKIDSELRDTLSGRKDVLNEIFNDSNLSDKEIEFVKFRTGIANETSFDVFGWWAELGKEDKDKLNSIMDKVDLIPSSVPADKQDLLKLDSGSKAALMGYDAITTGANEYCVVLNRTKLIVKGE